MIEVIDNYFPDWLVKNVSQDLELYPVTYTNSSNLNGFEYPTTFFGNTLLVDDNLTGNNNWWFISYFNQCIYNDICKKYNINHCVRILLNGQVPTLNGTFHRDADNKEYLSVIYMGHGTSGDTVFETEKVSFKEGRLVIFNANTLHRGDAPTEGYRVSLGAVYPLFDPLK